MRIALNATDGPLSLRAIRRYVGELASGLARVEDIDLELVFFTHRGLRIRRFLDTLPADARYRVRWLPLPRRMLQDRYRHRRWELERLSASWDLYHETTVDNPALPSTPVLTTVHGLCPLVAPEICEPAFRAEKAAWFERCLDLSDYFTPVSETSRREFLARFDVLPERVRTIRLGISAQYRPDADGGARRRVRTRHGVDRPYLLYVGGIQANKNVVRVLRTFRRLRERRQFAGQLVLAGDLHYGAEEFQAMLESEGIAGDTYWLGCFAPEDPDLADIYRAAELFLFPSYYEGWTSPPLEAMASGVPVVASSASSIPETVGEGGLLADPDDEDAWVEQAARILRDGDLRRALVLAGARRAAQFPWRRTVDETVTFYRDIIAAPSRRAGSPLDESAAAPRTG